MASPMAMVVSHDLELQQAFASVLGQHGLAPILASTVQEAIAILSRQSISLIFCSDELPGCRIDGFVQRASQPPSEVPVVVVSRFDEWEHYLKALRAGAFDYLVYPLVRTEIERVVQSALGLGVVAMVRRPA